MKNISIRLIRASDSTPIATIIRKILTEFWAE